MGRKIRLCERCETRPVRRRRGARYCSPCVSIMPRKTCAQCGEVFHPDMMNGPRCKPCASKKAHEKRVQDTYGLAPGQYDELLAFQGGVDAVTGQAPGAKRLAVDHDHATGEVRGLLVKHTNFYVIGWAERFEDPVGVFKAAIEYLENPPAKRLWGDDVPRQPEGES